MQRIHLMELQMSGVKILAALLFISFLQASAGASAEAPVPVSESPSNCTTPASHNNSTTSVSHNSSTTPSSPPPPPTPPTPTQIPSSLPPSPPTPRPPVSHNNNNNTKTPPSPTPPPPPSPPLLPTPPVSHNNNTKTPPPPPPSPPLLRTPPPPPTPPPSPPLPPTQQPSPPLAPTQPSPQSSSRRGSGWRRFKRAFKRHFRNFTPEFDWEQQQYLEAHNELRRQMGLPPLQWDAGLTSYAHSWAMRRRHDCKYRNHSEGQYGENSFWMQYKDFTPTEVVQQWFSEQKFFDHNKNVCRCKIENEDCECGHYLNVIWKTTKRVGCSGYVYCGNQQGLLVYCSYDPRGNIKGINPLDPESSVNKLSNHSSGMDQ